jgi:Zn-dependent peptidase ImmA (M78 family)
LKLKLPKTFYIKGTKWTCRRKKNIKLDGDECNGLTDVDKKLIFIKSGMDDAKEEWVFWHEYFHAILSETSVTGNTGGMSDLAEEIVCDAFAACMVTDKIVRFKRTRKLK